MMNETQDPTANRLTEKRICSACKHCLIEDATIIWTGLFDGERGRKEGKKYYCRHPNLFNPVTGESQRHRLRSLYGETFPRPDGCGPEGAWFSAGEPARAEIVTESRDYPHGFTG